MASYVPITGLVGVHAIKDEWVLPRDQQLRLNFDHLTGATWGAKKLVLTKKKGTKMNSIIGLKYFSYIVDGIEVVEVELEFSSSTAIAKR